MGEVQNALRVGWVLVSGVVVFGHLVKDGYPAYLEDSCHYLWIHAVLYVPLCISTDAPHY
jgi:hypothetical protein